MARQQNQRNAVGPSAALRGSASDNQVVGSVRIADPNFAAIDEPATIDFLGVGAQGCSVAASPRFSQRQCKPRLTFDQARQKRLSLFLAGKCHERHATKTDDGGKQGRGNACVISQPLVHQCHASPVFVHAAISGWKWQTQQAQFPHAWQQMPRRCVRTIGGAISFRWKLPGHHPIDRRQQNAIFFGNFKINHRRSMSVEKMSVWLYKGSSRLLKSALMTLPKEVLGNSFNEKICLGTL